MLTADERRVSSGMSTTVRFSALLQEGYLSGLLEHNSPAGPSRRFYDLGSPTLPDLLRGPGEETWTATDAWRSFLASIREGAHFDRESVVLDGVDAFFDRRDDRAPLAEELDRIADRAGVSVESAVAVAVLGSMRERLLVAANREAAARSWSGPSRNSPVWHLRASRP